MDLESTEDKDWKCILSIQFYHLTEEGLDILYPLFE